MKIRLDDSAQAAGIPGHLLLLKRSVILLLVCLTIFAASSPLIKSSPAKASGWAGWDAVSTIYYNPAQDDADNHYLQQAATELRDNLQEVGETLTITTSSRPASGSIYLEVNSSHPDLIGRNDEAFKLFSDSNGIYIAGKTPIAVRDGAYTLLEKLGFRWFFKNPAWTVVPDSLTSFDGLNEVQEPAYIYRAVQMGGTQGASDMEAWTARNREIGTAFYGVYHSYAAILNYATGWNSMTAQQKVDFGNAHADVFLPNDRYPYTVSPSNLPDKYPWQLNPYSATVQSWAINYANYALGLTGGGFWGVVITCYLVRPPSHPTMVMVGAPLGIKILSNKTLPMQYSL